jgi:hypothetical protein
MRTRLDEIVDEEFAHLRSDEAYTKIIRVCVMKAAERIFRHGVLRLYYWLCGNGY